MTQQYPTYPAYSAQPVPTPEKPHKGSAVTALVTGIIGSVFGLVPILSIISFPCAILAITFGLIARKRAMGKWGVALGVLALVLAIISFVIIQRAVSDFGHCTDAVSNDLQNNTNTSDAACN